MTALFGAKLRALRLGYSPSAVWAPAMVRFRPLRAEAAPAVVRVDMIPPGHLVDERPGEHFVIDDTSECALVAASPALTAIADDRITAPVSVLLDEDGREVEP